MTDNISLLDLFRAIVSRFLLARHSVVISHLS